MSLSHMVRQEVELFPLRQAEAYTSVSGLSGQRGFLQTPDWLGGNPWVRLAGRSEWEGELPGSTWI